MPYPSQVNPKQIVTTAAELIEAHGVETLSMTRLGDALGVKAPSLYRYFNGKTALLRAVNTLTRQTINAGVLQAMSAATESPRASMRAMAHAYRDGALRRPAAYGLAYTNTIDDLRVSEEIVQQLWDPLLPRTIEFVGMADALVFLNGIWALSHGYIMLEICGNLRHEGDWDAMFARLVEAYLDGWE